MNDIIERDDGGIRLSTKEAKIYYEKSTWATRIGYFLRNGKKVLISTYSLPDVKYINHMFDRQGFENVTIIANSRFRRQAEEIKNEYPEITIYLEENNHEKVALCEPQTIIIGSANFGHSGWKEMSVGLKSKEAYDVLAEQYKERLLSAEKVEDTYHRKWYENWAEEIRGWEEQDRMAAERAGTPYRGTCVNGDYNDKKWFQHYGLWRSCWFIEGDIEGEV